MEKKLKRMRMIRRIAITPFILTLLIAIYFGIEGADIMLSTHYGPEAIILTLVMLSVLGSPVYITAIITIIATSISIKRIRKASVEKPVESVEISDIAK